MEKITIKSLFIQGLYVILPTFLFVFLLTSIFSFLKDTLQPFVELLPKGTAFGFGYPNIAIIIFFTIMVFAAGFASIRSGFGSHFVDKIETMVPGYMLLKHLLSERVGERGTDLQPCLILIDDGWLFSFIVEEMEDGMLVVFLPGAPSIASGNVYIMDPVNVKRLDITKREAVKCIMQFGIGSSERLKGKVSFDRVKQS